MKKIWSINLEADTGSSLVICIEAKTCSDALNVAFKKYGKLFPHLKSVN